MQTTLQIDDAVYHQAKARAVQEGITLTKFIEEALRLRLYTGQKVAGDTNRADFLARLQRLMEQARKRNHRKEGSAGPFSRAELYAERLARFR